MGPVPEGAQHLGFAECPQLPLNSMGVEGVQQLPRGTPYSIGLLCIMHLRICWREKEHNFIEILYLVLQFKHEVLQRNDLPKSWRVLLLETKCKVETKYKAYVPI